MPRMSWKDRKAAEIRAEIKRLEEKLERVLRGEVSDPRRKRCAVCGNKFEAHRSDALYCGNACKQAAFKSRKKQGEGLVTER